MMLQLSVAAKSEPSVQLQNLGREPLRMAQVEPPSCGRAVMEATGIAFTVAMMKAAQTASMATTEGDMALDYGRKASNYFV